MSLARSRHLIPRSFGRAGARLPAGAALRPLALLSGPLAARSQPGRYWRHAKAPRQAASSAPRQRRCRGGSIHKAAHRLIWVGEVEAADESAAIEKAAEQLGITGSKLIATRRG